jgi:hypothetical protein
MSVDSSSFFIFNNILGEITLSLGFQMLKIQTRTFVGIGSSNWNMKKLEDTVESFFFCFKQISLRHSCRKRLLDFPWLITKTEIMLSHWMQICFPFCPHNFKQTIIDQIITHHSLLKWLKKKYFSIFLWSKLFSDFVTTDEIIWSLDFQMLKIQTKTFFGIGSCNWNKKKLEDTVESFFRIKAFKRPT